MHLLPVRSFLLLLGDPETSVRRAMLRSLAAFMAGIAGMSARDDAKLGAELASHIVSLEASLGLDWRAHQGLLLAVPALTQVALSHYHLLRDPNCEHVPRCFCCHFFVLLPYAALYRVARFQSSNASLLYCS